MKFKLMTDDQKQSLMAEVYLGSLFVSSLISIMIAILSLLTAIVFEFTGSPYQDIYTVLIIWLASIASAFVTIQLFNQNGGK